MSIGTAEILIILTPLVLGLAGSAFWLWMLADCVANESEEDETRRRWISLVALTHCFGALLYFLIRRPRRSLMRTSNPLSCRGEFPGA